VDKLLALLAICGLCISANAQEFRVYGSKSLGMGTAGVASAKNSYLGYLNPALIVDNNYANMVLIGGVGGGVSEGGFANSVQRIKVLDLYKILEGIKNNIPDVKVVATSTSPYVSIKLDGKLKDYQKLNEGIDIVSKMGNQQLLTVIAPHASWHITKNMVVGLYGEITTSGELTTNLDANMLIIKNDGLDIDAKISALTLLNQRQKDEAKQILAKYKYLKINTNSGEFEISNKQEFEKKSFVNAMIGENPNIQAKISITKIFSVPISYATNYHLFNLPNDIKVGGSLKSIFIIQALKKTKLSEAEDFLLPSAQSAFCVGLDLGGAYVFNNDGLSDGLTLALVAKNLNSPSVDINNHTITIEPQIRFGVAYPMWGDTLEVALDYDITNNKLTESKHSSKYLALGIDYEPFSWLGVRAGMKQNMGSNPITNKPIMTAGLNFGAKWLYFEGAFGIATEKFRFKTDGKTKELPAYLEGSFAIVSKWGGNYIRKHPQIIQRKSNFNNQLYDKANKAKEELKKEVKQILKAV